MAIVCSCNVVGERTLREAVRAGADSLPALRKATNAGVGKHCCMNCTPSLHRSLAERLPPLETIQRTLQTDPAQARLQSKLVGTNLARTSANGSHAEKKKAGEILGCLIDAAASLPRATKADVESWLKTGNFQPARQALLAAGLGEAIEVLQDSKGPSDPRAAVFTIAREGLRAWKPAATTFG